MDQGIRQLVENRSYLFIQQVKEWAEILIDFESRNKYQILDENQAALGFAAESDSGFLSFIGRQILRTHRSMNVSCFDQNNQLMLKLKRPFFFFFSDLEVTTASGQFLGSVHRRFGIIYKKYDLLDEKGQLFATIKAPLWNLWTFPILNERGHEVGVITKKWGGLLKEFFTDADRFGIQLPQEFAWEKRVVSFAAALSIDMDFFDDNQSR